MSWRLLLARPTLTPDDLRAAFRAALEESKRFALITEVHDAPYVLEVRGHAGATSRIDLERLYHNVVRTEPAGRASRVEDHLASILESADGGEGRLPAPTRDQLVPTIKSLAWYAGAAQYKLAVSRLVADLVIVYAWDRPRTLAFATQTDMEQLALSAGEARELALENLRRRLPQSLTTRGDGKSFLFAAGGNIEASLLLVPEVWDDLAAQLAGDPIACALARDVLLVTATGVEGGLDSLFAARDRIRNSMAPSELISLTLLVRGRGSWAALEPA
jgi:hypothetical protein